MNMTSSLVRCFMIPASTNAIATSVGFKVLGTSIRAMLNEKCGVDVAGRGGRLIYGGRLESTKLVPPSEIPKQ